MQLHPHAKRTRLYTDQEIHKKHERPWNTSYQLAKHLVTEGLRGGDVERGEGVLGKQHLFLPFRQVHGQAKVANAGYAALFEKHVSAGDVTVLVHNAHAELQFTNIKTSTTIVW